MLKPLENILKNEIDPTFAKRARLIFEHVEKNKPKKILDAGCGRGFYINSLTNFSFIKEIHGFDINEKYLKIAKQNISLIRHSRESGNPDKQKLILQKASIYSLPYPSSYFDFIICSEVLEHLNDDKKALTELKRVLKFKGTLIITVPNLNFPFLWDPLNWILMRVFNTHVNKNIWWLAGIWADHERLYTLKELLNLVKRSGFKVSHKEKIIHWCWPFSHFFLYGIGKNLVEKIGLNNFNRFNYNHEKNFAQIVASLFIYPSLLLDRRIPLTSSVNIIVELK